MTGVSFDAASGTLTLTFDPGAGITDFDGNLILTPPANSDVDLSNVQVQATAVDPATGTPASNTPSTHDVPVDAVVDGSEVTQAAPVSGVAGQSVNLDLDIDLGGDSTTGGTPGQTPFESQGGTDVDGSESITAIQVTLSAGTLTFSDPSGALVAPPANAGDPWVFDTAGLSLADVQSLVDSFGVTPPAGFAGTIDISVVTTTAEVATAATGGAAGAGDVEVFDPDNADTDSYHFKASFTGIPVTGLVVNGAVGYIPEDVPSPVTIQADVAAGTSDVLTQVVVTGLPLNGSGWTVDTSQLGGLPGVTGVSFDGAGGTLTLSFDPSAGITDFDGDLILTPPANSDVDLTDVQVQATAVDPATGTPASNTPSTHDVPVDAVVDGSEVTQAATAAAAQGEVADLNLDIDLGGDSTTGGTPGQTPFEAQGGRDADGSESVTGIRVTLTAGSLTFSDPSGALVAPPASPTGPWVFDTSALSLLQVQALVDSFGVSGGADFFGTIGVTVETTTAEAATAATGGSAGGGDQEIFDPDNVDVDQYYFEATFTGDPYAAIVVNGAHGFIPEDTQAPITIQASPATGSSDVLTEVVVTGLPTSASGWVLDASQFAGLPGVLTVNFNPAAGALTITLDPAAGITDFEGDLLATPPTNSDVDWNGVQVVASAVNPTTGVESTGAPAGADIVVDAIVDGTEVLQDGQVIDPGDGVSGDENGIIDLELSLDLSDQTSLNGAAPDGDAPFTQGGGDADGSETVKSISVTLSPDSATAGLPALLFTLSAGITVDAIGGVPSADGSSISWQFSVADGTDLATVNGLIESLQVQPAPEYSGDIGVTLQTTTTETALNGAEVNTADNSDIDTYSFQVWVEPLPGTLVVGSNEDDDPSAPTDDTDFDHTVPNPTTLPDNDGAVTGLPGDDVLVGDPGGVATESIPPGDYNVVLILDISGSMDRSAGNGQTRLELLQDAVNNLLGQLADHDGTVNIFIQTFSSEALGAIEFLNFGQSSLNNARSFVNNLEADGWTNYQDPLIEGTGWLQDQLTTTDDFNNLLFFVSDGNPNTINGGQDGGSSAQNALNAALNEPLVADALDQSSGTFTGDDAVQVNAIGIGSGVTESILDQVDNTPRPGLDQQRRCPDREFSR